MIDYGIGKRLRDFDSAHGDYVVNNGWIFYEDGATRETNPWGCLAEPPSDIYECAKLKVRFCKLKLELAIEEFSTCKRDVLLQAQANLKEKYCPAPTSTQQEAVTSLKKLKQKVESCKRKLREAQTNLENAKPAYLREREITAENNRHKNQELLLELQRIEI
jgi:hypothetical protein